MLAALAFSASVISYCIYTGVDTEVNQTAVSMGFITIISIVGSYVFGATWDDKNIYKKD